MSTTLISGGTIVTMNAKREILRGDLRFADEKIVALAPRLAPKPGEQVIDASNCFVIPGLIQAHTHLCQVLFRGLADDMELLDWLKKRIWPFEAAHTAKSLKVSAQLGLLEMQLLGTTTILDMGTVHHTHALLEAVEESGMRYVGGKCLMDKKSGPLGESFKNAWGETEQLIKDWSGRSPLIEYALCPRFVLSCSEKLLKECVRLQEKTGILIHTHASESKAEVALVRKASGLNNVAYLRKLGVYGPRSVIVHGVHLTPAEIKMMVKDRTPLVHCPSANLKLASGIAPIQRYLDAGMTVALGADGAPCNNTMDPFKELHLAAMLQKPGFGPRALPAQQAFELATLHGARTLGRESELGSLERGKFADIVIVKREHPTNATVEDPYSALVYSGSGRDVRDVFIHGRPIVRRGRHVIFDQAAVIEDARDGIERQLLLNR